MKIKKRKCLHCNTVISYKNKDKNNKDLCKECIEQAEIRLKILGLDINL